MSTYQSAADCPLGAAHGSASSFTNPEGVRCCDFCGFPVEPTVSKPDVPFEKVEALAANIKELLDHHARQSVVQAKLLRWCVWAMNQTTAEAERMLERERRNHPNPAKRIVRLHEPGKKVREDKAKALLYLEWLATQMENRGPAEP